MVPEADSFAGFADFAMGSLAEESGLGYIVVAVVVVVVTKG